MMRPETEVPSDFQDYTLVTVVSVAAHLSGHELGDKAGLAALAQRYRQDFVALEQVFQYVMQSLSQYRRVSRIPQEIAVMSEILKPFKWCGLPCSVRHQAQTLAVQVRAPAQRSEIAVGGSDQLITLNKGVELVLIAACCCLHVWFIISPETLLLWYHNTSVRTTSLPCRMPGWT